MLMEPVRNLQRWYEIVQGSRVADGFGEGCRIRALSP